MRYISRILCFWISLCREYRIEVLEEIQREDPQSRIVMCSAVGQEQMIQQAVMLGAKDFIVKPFRPDEFRRIVRNAIES